MIKVVSMGFSRKRIGRDGKPRYTAYYLDIRGQERSAGTFASKKASDKAWQDEEAKIRAQMAKLTAEKRSEGYAFGISHLGCDFLDALIARL